MGSTIQSTFPLTVKEWRETQETGDGLARLLSLRESEARLKSNAWITLATPSQIEEQWAHAESLRSSGASLPLFGVPFAAKDNIDVASFPTTAACPSFATGPVDKDAAVIARLKTAGAIVLGKTNLDQFATGLVGTRSPYGPVSNSFDPARVSGGSSSGSSVVVARGVVPFSLGTDTAGSGRVPAGLNNLVGLKPTRGALSTTRVLPACRSLDCVSIFTLTVDDAETVLAAAEGFDPEDSFSRARPDTPSTVKGHRMAVCDNPPWFGKTEQAAAYAKALEKAETLGWTLEPVDFSPLFQLASLLYEGPWVAERYAAIKDFIEARESEMDPTVREIILKAKGFNAADLFASEYLRQDLTRQIQDRFAEFDAILVPTAPTFPTIEDLAREPIKENAYLGTYTNFVNFMDWTALSIPAGFRSDGLPFGITLISSTWDEPKLLSMAREWLSTGPRPLGATRIERLEARSSDAIAAGEPKTTRLVVVGAHLTGFPLNKDLTSRGATLEIATTTSPNYRFYSLNTGGTVKKPGLKRVPSGGSAIQVEVWSLPTTQLGSFLKTVPSPLGIGSVELADGSWALGFICEPYGLDGATDITSFGGWRAFIKSLIPDVPPVGTISKVSGIRSVLIANRGEIAVRVIRTLHSLGLKAITIHSSADARSPHVRNADVSLPLTGTSVSETYLNGVQIIALAKKAGADAIIPGYGFLAENADFASAVEAEGLIWVGPTAEQMRQLGLKHLARDVAIGAGVPVVPGSKHLLKSAEEALDEAERIQYPVMLKSTAGGGGIGLKRCDDAASLVEAFESVQRLAQANFGDAGVFVEHFIEHARHIEVQIIGDGYGRVTSAGERDCSLQRRNQKVIEESPAIFVPPAVRRRMRKAAVDLGSAVKYRNVGTIEFIYDVDTSEFFFLEVNTRLQVEHPVTESVTGLDLVECMIRVASGNSREIFVDKPEGFEVKGSSIEVRVYAESPLQNFRPSPGRLLDVSFPEGVRVDTWVEAGMEMSSSYDPLVAKIIATGEDRTAAIAKLADALQKTVITGVETNLEYARHIVASEMFRSGTFTTTSLNSFAFDSSIVEVVDPGTLTAVQDYPGRKGLWHVGVPPSGPFDDYSFRLANRLVGNDSRAAGLECTIHGPSLLFHYDAVVAVTGAFAEVKIDNKPAQPNTPLTIQRGQKISIGAATSGYRSYLAVRGGFDVPEIFNSRSTFALGKVGGHNGRNLRSGDLLPVGSMVSTAPSADSGPAIPLPSDPANAHWSIGVVPGQHSAPEHFTEEGFSTLFADEWTVHYNSNRIGIRLDGPKPQWARETGGEAGLHPSNIHDSPYSVGSVSFTGDEAVILTCDGPSLGGFVVFCVVASAEMWKLGQLRPGDKVKLQPITVDDALFLESALEKSIAELTPLAVDVAPLANSPTTPDSNPFLGDIGSAGRRISVRQAGDNAMLLEFGTEDVFSLRQSFQIFSFIARHKTHPIPDVLELSPGVRTLHVQYTPKTPPATVLSALRAHETSLGEAIPSAISSRTIHLPLAFDDSVSRAAVARYVATIRATAPWLPSNVDFLQRLNALDAPADVERIFLDATFLVLGLGDVFLGSPCAVPLDPRHRLFGTKYNPSRSFTPRGAVGIGGQYMCIYGMDSPGGYQLVGRTVPIWDDVTASAVASRSESKPWLFRLFDRISFYPVSEMDLDASIDQGRMTDLVKIEEGSLDLEAYEAWLAANKADIDATRGLRAGAIRSAPFMEELLQPYNPPEAERRGGAFGEEAEDSTPGERIKAQMPGRCWKCEVKAGDEVDVGDALVWIESNKMEIKIGSPIKGKVVKMLVAEGDIVGPYDDLLIVETQ
ncbi:Putative biotin/lipoyl attachment, Carboxyltransferase domain, subdomain A and B, biotin carboxylase [Colletotrichum destructivum]|uniref:Biotin/lipoyl attachment, Carboxyltransferase domain, subdomain A and B, biotin carboxylase n=1 Tax=Colletotrichum destructivum TaxID=34406 RepID=A0AAX4IF09_9PEZI|nr:Putative biotin/lipoyl attachment, Carboxyltransferase domain, subdomain A and B, biotin carboxylase [Colletotrichum destructivum]